MSIILKYGNWNLSSCINFFMNKTISLDMNKQASIMHI